jgi:hypothetical protein
MAMGDSVREAMHNAQYGTARREDAVTRTVESQTTAIPSIAFLGVALGSMALSLALLLTGRRQAANFVGQWAPTILIMGLYNKLVKQHGSDYQDETVAS